MTKYIVVPTQIPAFRFIETSDDSIEGQEFPELYIEAYMDALSELEKNIREIKLDVTHMRIQQILNSDEGPEALKLMDPNVISNFILDNEED